MSVAILTSVEDATVLIAAIDAVRGYPRDGTATHAIPRRHPAAGEWAVPLDGLDPAEPWLAGALTGVEVVERLPDDWYPGGYP